MESCWLFCDFTDDIYAPIEVMQLSFFRRYGDLYVQIKLRETKMTDEKSLTSCKRGRPKGSLNKTTKLLKDAILKAAAEAGYNYGSDGLVSYLQYHAINNPAPFFSLLAKVLPLQLTGEAGGDVKTISRVEIVPVIAKEAVSEEHDISTCND